MPLAVLATDARPVALMLTTRSWLPTEGVARQIFNVPAAAPTPVGC
jgi:hypothetical protein